MEIITLLLVIVLARFTIRGLFNTEWREKAQEKIDSIKKRRWFWKLITGIGDGLVLDAEDVFRAYLDSRHLSTVFGRPVFDKEKYKETLGDTKIKNLIKDKGMAYDLVENMGVLNKAIDEREEIIKELLEKRTLTYTKAEVKETFAEQGFSEQYKRLALSYFDFLPDRGPVKEEHEKIWKELEAKKVLPAGSLKHSTSDEYSLNEIWQARKKLEEMSRRDEWKTEDKKVDSGVLYSLKMSQTKVGEVVALLLCEEVINEKSEDTKSREALKIALRDWEQLHMLRWCILDYSPCWINTDRIQRFKWRVLESIS